MVVGKDFFGGGANMGFFQLYNTEEYGIFGSELPPEESHITPRGNLPPVWEPLS